MKWLWSENPQARAASLRDIALSLSSFLATSTRRIDSHLRGVTPVERANDFEKEAVGM